MGNTAAKKQSTEVDMDPRSPSSRTPVGKIVKERKATIVEFNLDSPVKKGEPVMPGTPEAEPVDYDPRSPSSRTPVAALVKERKLSVVQPIHFDEDQEEENSENQFNTPVSKPQKPFDLQKTAVYNAHKQATIGILAPQAPLSS